MSTSTIMRPTPSAIPQSVHVPRCRFCQSPLQVTFADLGMSPLCESYLSVDQINHMEPFYPLHVYVCGKCFLVQVEEFVAPEQIFTEYAYFSSYSESWLAHGKAYTDMAARHYGLSRESLVVELASNDGYLLQYFVEKGIPVLGVEPAVNVAKVAVAKGVPTLVDFFGQRLAREMAARGQMADLVVGNNVLAQVPDVNDFVAGIKIILKEHGAVTIEFPHLLRLVEGNQLDTIYHEHFSYFSLIAAQAIFAAHGLTIFDVEELKTHGGSLRLHIRHAEDAARPVTEPVRALVRGEEAAGYRDLAVYRSFSRRAQETKWDLQEFLIQARRQGKRVVGYGAPGKGNTLLNYCGIRADLIEFTVDRNPYKQGKFLPGTHIPIEHPDKITAARPDYLFILPWNLKDEIIAQNAFIRDWGGRFVVPIPKVQVIE